MRRPFAVRDAVRAGLAAALVAAASPCFAQLDPLLPITARVPTVLLLLDTSIRMQRDAPADPEAPIVSSSYLDPVIYTRTGAAWETSLGLERLAPGTRYRRRYAGLRGATSGSSASMVADSIAVVAEPDVGYAAFDASTRLAVARAALARAVADNQSVVRFGLLQTRQTGVQAALLGNAGPVIVANAAQQSPSETGTAGQWAVSLATTAAPTPAAEPAASGVLTRADAPSAADDVVGRLTAPAGAPWALVAASADGVAGDDAPVGLLLFDALNEVGRLAAQDVTCRNTVVVLVTGGGNGSASGAPALSEIASRFLTAAGGRRVPVYVLAIAPPASDVSGLQAVAAATGGGYAEVSRAQIQVALGRGWPGLDAGTIEVPEAIAIVNAAVAHAFVDAGALEAPGAVAGSAALSEFQLVSPVIGTVNLAGARNRSGQLLPDTVVRDRAGAVIPQYGNVIITAGLALPGLVGTVRATRLYVPVVDPARPGGYRFVGAAASAAARLWTAATPRADRRNLFTSMPDGSMVSLDAAHAEQVAPLMGVDPSGRPVTADLANAIIAWLRARPIGPVIDSTPAVEGPPAQDPAPDVDYPAFAASLSRRRALVWVGTSDGVLEAIDARTGLEVWGFVPPTLLPSLKSALQGQALGRFAYRLDASPHLVDVKVGASWRTHLIFGLGPGGTFYHSLDVTLQGLADAVPEESDDSGRLLEWFAAPGRISLNWTFPALVQFDAALQPAGDIAASATPLAKSVGQTWATPVVARIGHRNGPFAVMVGSGFLPRARELAPNRRGAGAGTTFYLLSATDGHLFAAQDVGRDGLGEQASDCGVPGESPDGCRFLKNALQSDPAGMGPVAAPFVTRVYQGDLDGKLWRFDLALDGRGDPTIASARVLTTAGADQPLVGGLAVTATSGDSAYVFFASGSDRLPPSPLPAMYHLSGVLDAGGDGVRLFDVALATGHEQALERPTSAPAVAGGVVFFTTTRAGPLAGCAAPDANLFAMAFTGAPAYDTTGDGRVVVGQDSVLVKTVSGRRATAPFVADGHLVFGVGGQVSIVGDSQNYNSGVGRTGIRVLSWREVR